MRDSDARVYQPRIESLSRMISFRRAHPSPDMAGALLALATRPRLHSAVSAGTVLPTLVALEGDIRKICDDQQLHAHAISETRRLLHFDAAFWLTISKTGRPEVVAGCTGPKEKASCLVSHAVEKSLANLPPRQPQIFDFVSPAAGLDYAQGCYVPMAERSGEVFAALLFLRAKGAFSDVDDMLCQRLAGTYGHAALALMPHSLRARLALRWRR